jgi:hypothetical protein
MTNSRSWMFALALVLGASAVASADENARKQAQSQVEFGIAVAQICFQLPPIRSQFMESSV